MYMKLQIFTQTETLKILEQKDTSSNQELCDIYGICVRSIHGPEIVYCDSRRIIFYIRGDDHGRDFEVLDYLGEKTLQSILKALSTIATVNIIWS